MSNPGRLCLFRICWGILPLLDLPPPVSLFAVTSTTIPVAELSLPIVGRVAELIIKIATNPQLSLHSSTGNLIANYLNFPTSGSSDSTTLIVSTTVEKGEIISISADWQLKVASLSVAVEAGPITVLDFGSVPATVLDLETHFSIDIEAGRAANGGNPAGFFYPSDSGALVPQILLIFAGLGLPALIIVLMNKNRGTKGRFF